MASSSGNDDDLTIPRAAINKMIKETLPNVRVANDARELVVNCCTEFIHLISSEANEICNKSEKKTISPEHVIQGQTATSRTGPARMASNAVGCPTSTACCCLSQCI
ncbi:down-regulator of transcription 1 [Phyllostomus discolor]|uniref:Protein Dr1 n=1 Tax=Phyllostomus discolor TaxID=89673 RepID=A0A834ACD0_9CHIR|nr:down-regulator of transcription 1 [Phyllostomus discolor]